MWTQLSYLPNPVDFDAVDTAKRSPIEEERLPLGSGPLIVALGRLCPQKDYETMFRAFRRCSGKRAARLAVLGEGESRAELERLAEELGLAGKVHLLGFQREPLRWLARADVFLMTSRWEGCPLALLEAVAMGLKVVATDCPSGPAEILRDYSRGALVPMGDEEAICAALEKFIDTRFAEVPEQEDAFRQSRSPQAVARRYLALA